MAVQALLFDVFGTVVDWRGSLIGDLTAWGRTRGLDGDWAGLVDAWRSAYVPSMNEVRRHPGRGFVALEDLQRASLERLAPRFGLPALGDDDLDHINMGWRRLKPWPDSVAGLMRLKSRFLIAPLSNGNLALTAAMAKQAGLPWDVVFGTDLFGHYKPDREVYLGAARLLRLEPSDLMMVAAHNGDLEAAQRLGLKTAFVARPTEYGPHQTKDLAAEGDWDVVARDFGDLADRLGCG
jgi:2-haloacid dehalogenase